MCISTVRTAPGSIPGTGKNIFSLFSGFFLVFLFGCVKGLWVMFSGCSCSFLSWDSKWLGKIRTARLTEILCGYWMFLSFWAITTTIWCQKLYHSSLVKISHHRLSLKSQRYFSLFLCECYEFFPLSRAPW